MSDLFAKAEYFRSLHVRGQPLVLFNIWDVGSAQAVESAGALALATGSWSVAKANGYEDGEQLPLELALSNLLRIARATQLPVSLDLENGYGKQPDDVAQTITRSIDAGAVGCNIEDSDCATGALREIADQAERIRHARKAALATQIPYFINARTDVFFTAPQASDDQKVTDVLERAKAYAEAGANGLFVPGLAKRDLIERIAAASPLPLNIMAADGTPSLRALAALGVARVSHGPGPYRTAMKHLEDDARQAMRRS